MGRTSLGVAVAVTFVGIGVETGGATGLSSRDFHITVILRGTCGHYTRVYHGRQRVFPLHQHLAAVFGLGFSDRDRENRKAEISATHAARKNLHAAFAAPQN